MNEQITQLSNEASKLIKPQFEKIDEIVSTIEAYKVNKI